VVAGANEVHGRANTSRWTAAFLKKALRRLESSVLLYRF
jgi:hypothetical protein